MANPLVHWVCLGWEEAISKLFQIYCQLVHRADRDSESQVQTRGAENNHVCRGMMASSVKTHDPKLN